MELFNLCSRSAEQTRLLGEQLGRLLPAGSLVLLQGDLGAGKTCLATGIARGVGVDSATPITSPTYTLLNSYQGQLPLYHFDLYRLADGEELDELGFDEYFNGDGVALVEWPERHPELIEQGVLIELSYVDECSRQLKVSASPEFCTRFPKCCEAIRQLQGEGACAE